MGNAPPSGIVSFLFTDVEGSTRLWESDPAAMSASLAHHDGVLRTAIAAHRGTVFSTAGDAFAAAFHTASDALGAALTAQLTMTGDGWPGPPVRVRMGIHAGEAEERDGDYFGPVMNRAARIMAAGHGGQILLSGLAAEMATTWLPAGTTLEDLGSHRLKDLADPEQLFVVRHEALPDIDLPVRASPRGRHNLTEYLTSLVGREAELEQLSGLVREHRLVVLTGVGGTGKTRLAVEGAHRLVAGFRDGCWLVELASVTDPALILPTIGEALGLRPGPGVPIDDVLARHLADKLLLLVIDNCEHLLDGAIAAITALLSSGPDVTVLATSRESLGIPGEVILRVPSLRLPEDPHHIRDAAAVRLFLDRARQVRPGFDPEGDELETVRRICARIDGIPLGLELAAARLRSLSSGELADRLDESFRILAGGAKVSLPRQRTLNATIDWSHDLLDAAERAVFRRAALFVGGFDLATAEAVCAGERVEPVDVLDHLDSLVDKSLLIATHDGELGTRYRMLEPVRQYAQERLSSSGEAAEVRMRHAARFVAAVARAAPFVRGPEQEVWKRRLDADYANVRAAFASLLEAGRIDAYLDMAFDLFCYWQHAGLHFQGIPTTEAGLEASPADTDLGRRVKAFFTMAALGFETTLPRAVGDARRGLDLASESGDPNLIGRMELALGAAIRHATTRDDYGEHVLAGRELLTAHPEPRWWEPEWEEAFHHLLYSGYLPPGTDGIREHSEAAIAGFARLGDEAQLAAALCESAMQVSGEPSSDDWIVDNLRRAAQILERIDVPYWHGHAYYFLGVVEHFNGHNDNAMLHLTESFAHLEHSGDVACWAGAMRTYAQCAVATGEAEHARHAISAVLERVESLPMPERAKPRVLSVTVAVLAALGRLPEAATALGAIVALGTDYPATPFVPQPDELHRRLTAELGTETAAARIAEGATLGVDDALARAGDWLAEQA